MDQEGKRIATVMCLQNVVISLGYMRKCIEAVFYHLKKVSIKRFPSFRG